jgi:hypothetical protein
MSKWLKNSSLKGGWFNHPPFVYSRQLSKYASYLPEVVIDKSTEISRTF